MNKKLAESFSKIAEEGEVLTDCERSGSILFRNEFSSQTLKTKLKLFLGLIGFSVLDILFFRTFFSEYFSNGFAKGGILNLFIASFVIIVLFFYFFREFFAASFQRSFLDRAFFLTNERLVVQAIKSGIVTHSFPLSTIQDVRINSEGNLEICHAEFVYRFDSVQNMEDFAVNLQNAIQVQKNTEKGMDSMESEVKSISRQVSRY